nr:uncharacterized protein LOC109154451 [Ipomoea trifida]GLL20484.1 uncharacterized protein LOC109154451 [Ipomoea trifida]GLL33946.1 uncharacterized protein LOC109154451 [Ipomoea trifida]GLL39933.1 uncharacterized protein LOC109154451 [Ipomoea trifida]
MHLTIEDFKRIGGINTIKTIKDRLKEHIGHQLIKATINREKKLQKKASKIKSGKELPEPILKKSTSPKSPIEEEIVEETLEEDKGQEKEEPSPPLSSKATQAQDKGKEKVDLPMYQPPLPFPGRVRKNIDTTQYGSQQGKSDGLTKNRKKASLVEIQPGRQAGRASGPRPVVPGRGSEGSLMDARAGRTRPRRVHQSPKETSERRKSDARSDARVRPASDVSAFPESKSIIPDASRTRVLRASDGSPRAKSEDETRGFKPNPSLSSSFPRTKYTPNIPPSKFFKFHPSLRPKIKAFFFTKAFNKQGQGKYPSSSSLFRISTIGMSLNLGFLVLTIALLICCWNMIL